MYTAYIVHTIYVHMYIYIQYSYTADDTMDYAGKFDINLLEYQGLRTATALPFPGAVSPFLVHVLPSIQTRPSGVTSPLY